MNWIIETLATITAIALIVFVGMLTGSDMERRAQEWQRMERKKNAERRKSKQSGIL